MGDLVDQLKQVLEELREALTLCSGYREEMEKAEQLAAQIKQLLDQWLKQAVTLRIF